MRAYGKQSHGPSWITALLIFLGLLVLLQFFREPSSRRLEEQFAARPPAQGAAGLALPPLPSGVAGLARTAIARLGAGQPSRALTPIAQSSKVRVDITAIKPVTGGLEISGAATNTGSEPLPVSLAAFRFTDAAGTVYVAEGATQTILQPGQRVPLDLTLPIAEPGQLILDVVLPGEPPLHMILLQTPTEAP